MRNFVSSFYIFERTLLASARQGSDLECKSSSNFLYLQSARFVPYHLGHVEIRHRASNYKFLYFRFCIAPLLNKIKNTKNKNNT